MKIKAPTILTAENKQYVVGQKIDGRTIEGIEDISITEQSGMMDCKYAGYYENGEPIFEIINAPVEVVYEKEKTNKGC